MNELTKQAIDQPIHFVVGFLAGLAVLAMTHAVIPYEFVFGAAIGVLVALPREVMQLPSRVWWDPILDLMFYALGGFTAGVIW